MRKAKGSVKAKGPKIKSSQAHPLLFIGSCLDNAWEEHKPAGENIMKAKCTKLRGQRKQMQSLPAADRESCNKEIL